MTNSEKKKMLKMVPKIYLHWKDNLRSLISRVYGIYKVKMEAFKPIHLMIIANTLRFENPGKIMRIYDLKGSTEMREEGVTKSTPPTKVLKDVDFIKNQTLKQEVEITRQSRIDLLRRMRSDSEFLRDQGIMDYSVLLGIEYNNPNETESSVGNLRRFTRHRAHSVLDKDRRLYHISIIDFLQPFNRGKRMENWAKSTFFFKDSKRLSAVEPVWYQERFF